MYFKYVIFCLSALLVQVINGQNAGFSCCDTSGTVPQLFENLRSGNNANFIEAITSCGYLPFTLCFDRRNRNQSKECSYLTEVFTLAGQEEDPCSSTADNAAGERYRRASNSNSAIGGNGSSCTTNLLRARLAIAKAKAKAAAADEQQEVFVAAKTVPVPTQLIPPKLLHKQSISLSPCPINVSAPRCSCASFGPSSLVNTNAVTLSQKLRDPNDANITNCKCTDLSRPLPPKPTASVGVYAVPIRIPDADEQQRSTTTAADVVAARLAQHRLLTGQQSNSGQCSCSINLPVPSSSGGSRNFISSDCVGSDGDFLVTSIGSEPLPSIAVDTDVTLLGNLNVCGTLPFVSAVQFEGLYDTIGAGSVSFGSDNSEPVTQPSLSNNAVTNTATIDSYRSPDMPRTPPKLTAIGAGATQAIIADADERQTPATTAVDAISACFAQHRMSTGQQCPQPCSLPTPICGCSSGGPCSFARAHSVPLTKKLENPSSNNAALTAALINNCRCPSLPGLSTEPDAVQSGVADIDYQLASATTRAAAVSARLAQHRLLTEQQSNSEQCPRCTNSPISKCSSSRGSSSSVIIPSSGSGLPVTSIGCESSPGIALDTEVTLSGNLDVCGTLPFMSAVQFQGLYDTIGSGAVSFGCGESEQVKLGIPNPNKAAFGTTTVNSCGQLPKYTDTPRALSAFDVADLQTKMADADERRATNMAAVVSARLAQHRLLTELTASNCDCGTVSSNFLPVPSSVGGLPVTSISPEKPIIDVDADIGLFGNLNVSGELPFQSAVEFQGSYDTFGSGTVSFGCENSRPVIHMFEN